MADAKKDIQKHLDILERQLSGKQFLVGDQFTLAEVCYLPFLQFLPMTEVEASPAIMTWSERLLSRPSAIQTKPER